MRRLDQLIAQSRRNTENTDFTEDSGIGDEEFITYANDAQEHLLEAIQNTFPRAFMEEVIIASVPGQEAYTLPDDVLLGSRIDTVEYSSNGSGDDYSVLREGYMKERISGVRSTPSWYVRRNNQILAQPAPSSIGSFRIVYQRRLPELDIRRGQVLTVTLDTNARTITSLALDPAVAPDAEGLLEENFITIVDKNGFQQMKRIPIDAVAPSGAVTVTPGFVYEAGETISVGDYALRGKDSTTNSELPKSAERYIRSYMNWKILKRDSSQDSVEAVDELRAIEEKIVDSYRVPDAEVISIAINDTQYLTFDEG